MNTHEKHMYVEKNKYTRDVPEGEGSWEQRKSRRKQSTTMSGMRCTDRSFPDDRGAGAFSGFASTSSSSPRAPSSGSSLGIEEMLSCLCILSGIKVGGAYAYKSLSPSATNEENSYPEFGYLDYKPGKVCAR